MPRPKKMETKDDTKVPVQNFYFSKMNNVIVHMENGVIAEILSQKVTPGNISTEAEIKRQFDSKPETFRNIFDL